MLGVLRRITQHENPGFSKDAPGISLLSFTSMLRGTIGVYLRDNRNFCGWLARRALRLVFRPSKSNARTHERCGVRSPRLQFWYRPAHPVYTRDVHRPSLPSCCCCPRPRPVHVRDKTFHSVPRVMLAELKPMFTLRARYASDVELSSLPSFLASLPPGPVREL